MLMPVIQAYIGDITPKGREGITMGLFNMSLFLGLSFGPVIGGTIKDHFSLQAAFICMGLLALIGFLLSLFLLPPTTSERAVSHGKNPFSWKMFFNDRHVVGLFLFRFAYVVCVGIIWGFIPLLADMEFAASSSLIGILVMLGVFVSGLIHVPMGYLADRISKTLMVAAGGLMISYAVLSFEWAGRIEDLVIATVIFGLGGGISMPPLMAMAVLKGSRINAMGSIMALMTVAHSLGMLCGALVGGLMMDFFQLRWAFPVGAVVMMICTAFFLASTYPQKQRINKN
jgi:predicted MFS family arabinose efflux permease